MRYKANTAIKILLLYFFMSTTFTAIAQVTGTPYGIAQSNGQQCPAPTGAGQITVSSVDANGRFTAMVTGINGATSYEWSFTSASSFATSGSTNGAIVEFIAPTQPGTHYITITVYGRSSCGSLGTIGNGGVYKADIPITITGGGSGCNLQIPAVGGVFTDCTGVEWRVISEDGSGNKLIITEYVYYNNTLDTPPNGQGSYIQIDGQTFQKYENSTGTTRPRMNEWYSAQTSSTLKSKARIPNLSYEYATNTEAWSADANNSAAYSSAGAAANGVTNGIVFPLSVSEVNAFLKPYGKDVVRGRAKGVVYAEEGRNYWLRSPGNITTPQVAVMSVYNRDKTYSYLITPVTVTTPFVIFFRPAMWIHP
jgi:hypothetical protein